MATHPAEKGIEEDPKVVVVQQPVPVVEQPQEYPQPTDAQGNVLTHNGQPYSQEVLRRYYSPDNKPGQFKDLSQIASEVESEKAAAQQGQQSLVAAPQAQAYQPLENWDSGEGFSDIAKRSEHSIDKLISDRNKWAKANNKEPLDYWEYAKLYQKYDTDKSVKDNEKEEKRRRNAELWGDAGHLLIGLGNFVGAIGGAPEPGAAAYAHAQKLKDSQRLRREKVMEQRKAYNRYLLEQMYKQRVEERAKEKHLADIGLIQGRLKALQDDNTRKDNEDRRKEEKNKADIERINAQTNYYNNKASHPYTKKVSGGRGRYKDTTFEELQNNIESYPDEAKAFAEEYGINGFDHKNQWKSSQAKMFNQRIENKKKGAKPATPQTPKTKNDYSIYKVKK